MSNYQNYKSSGVQVLVTPPVGDASVANDSNFKVLVDTIQAGGSGAVASVNGHTGTVVLTKSDVGLANVQNADTTSTSNIADATDKRFVTDAQRTALTNTSGSNSGDVTLATNSTAFGLSLSGQQLSYQPVVLTAQLLSNDPWQYYTYSNGTNGVGATLTTTLTYHPVFDGVGMQVGRYVLFVGFYLQQYNGLYVTTQVGVNGVTPTIFTRATTFDTSAKMQAGTSIYIYGGSQYRGSVYTLIYPVTTVGTDAITFSNNLNVGGITASSRVSCNSLQTSYIYSPTSTLQFGSPILSAIVRGTQSVTASGSISISPTYEDVTVALSSDSAIYINNGNSGYGQTLRLWLVQNNSGQYATGSVTLNVFPADGDTVTIENPTYTFRNNPDTSDPTQVQIDNTNISNNVQNLANAIVAYTGMGATVNGNTIYLTSIALGATGNETITCSASQDAFAAGSIQSDVTPSASTNDGDYVTLQCDAGTATFTLRNSPSNPNDVQLYDGDLNSTMNALNAAINSAGYGFTATFDGINTINIVSPSKSSGNVAIQSYSANGMWQTNGFSGGQDEFQMSGMSGGTNPTPSTPTLYNVIVPSSITPSYSTGYGQVDFVELIWVNNVWRMTKLVTGYSA